MLGESIINNPLSFPINFEINYNDEEFKNGVFGRFSLSVRIDSQSGDLLYITDTDFSIFILNKFICLLIFIML